MDESSHRSGTGAARPGARTPGRRQRAADLVGVGLGVGPRVGLGLALGVGLGLGPMIGATLRNGGAVVIGSEVGLTWPSSVSSSTS
jgi:hypothetical protein